MQFSQFEEALHLIGFVMYCSLFSARVVIRLFFGWVCLELWREKFLLLVVFGELLVHL